MAELPRLSHLQFLVVGLLSREAMSGHEIRERLREFGVRKSGPAFYQLMARLEEGDLVRGAYRQEVIEGQIIRERHYRITAGGSRAWEASRRFYVRAIGALAGSEGFAGA
jgi:DNA-binding PadR family transcriptional regulator